MGVVGYVMLTMCESNTFSLLTARDQNSSVLGVSSTTLCGFHNHQERRPYSIPSQYSDPKFEQGHRVSFLRRISEQCRPGPNCMESDESPHGSSRRSIHHQKYQASSRDSRLNSDNRVGCISSWF